MCVCACVHTVMFEHVLMCKLCISCQIDYWKQSPSRCTSNVLQLTLCLLSDLGHRVGALEISIIINNCEEGNFTWVFFIYFLNQWLAWKWVLYCMLINFFVTLNANFTPWLKIHKSLEKSYLFVQLFLIEIQVTVLRYTTCILQLHTLKPRWKKATANTWTSEAFLLF